MKRVFSSLALVGFVAACAQPAPEPTVEPTADAATEAAVPAAGPLAADGKSSVGKFRITTGDGAVFNEEVKADGTFVQTSQDGKKSETGRWVQNDPGTYCFTKDEPDAKETCHTEKVENGVWTTVSPDGMTAKVERIEG